MNHALAVRGCLKQHCRGRLSRGAGAAGGAGGPELPGLAAPVVHGLGALKVGAGAAGSRAAETNRMSEKYIKHEILFKGFNYT